MGGRELGPCVLGGTSGSEASQEEGEPWHAEHGTDPVLPPVVGVVHVR